jgi:hypothetical protein
LRGKEDIMRTDIPFCYFFALHASSASVHAL